MSQKFKPQFESLEERVLLSASPIDSQDIAISAPANQVENTQPTIQITEVLIIDSSIQNYSQLIQDLDKPSLEIHFIDSKSDGVLQVSNILSSYKNLDALHIVSHGSEGNINLGNSSLNADNLDSYQSLIQNWSKSFTDSADILIYGCDVAGNAHGQAFIDEISTLTGADIVASDDLTGYQGDSILEYQQGTIEAHTLINQEHFDQAKVTLADVIFTGTTEAELNTAIQTASDGTTIVFETDRTINFTNEIIINNAINFRADNAAKVVFDGQGQTRLFDYSLTANPDGSFKDVSITGDFTFQNANTVATFREVTIDPATLKSTVVRDLTWAQFQAAIPAQQANIYAATGSTAQRGGAISSANINLTLDGVTFDKSSSFNRGGALLHSSGKLVINNSTFSNNFTSTVSILGAFGGAIYTDSQEVSITNSTFTNNSARAIDSAAFGGAISSTTATINYKNNIFDHNFISAQRSTANGNTHTDAHGGAVYNTFFNNTVNTSFTFTDNTLSNNRVLLSNQSDAGYTDGQARAAGLFNSVSAATNTSTFTNNRVINNSIQYKLSTAFVDSNSSAQGAGIFHRSGNGSTNIFTANSFVGNSLSFSNLSAQVNSTTQGAGLYIEQERGGSSTLTNNTFSQNTLDAGTVGTARFEQGAGLFMDNFNQATTLNLYYNTLYNNTVSGNATNTNSAFHLRQNLNLTAFLYGNVITNPSTDTGNHMGADSALTLQGANNVISDNTTNLSNTFTDSTFAKDLTFDTVNDGNGILHSLVPRDVKLLDKGGSHDNLATATVTEYLTDQNGAITLNGADLRDVGAVEYYRPSLTANTAITINRNGDTAVNLTMLNATDVDSVDTNLKFIVNPTNFSFIKNNVAVTEFTVQDVTDGLITARHTYKDGTPSFTVRVSDGVRSSDTVAGVVSYNPTPTTIDLTAFGYDNFADFKAVAESAIDGDTLLFTADKTINFTSEIIITKAVNLWSPTANITFDGQGQTRLFDYSLTANPDSTLNDVEINGNFTFQNATTVNQFTEYTVDPATLAHTTGNVFTRVEYDAASATTKARLYATGPSSSHFGQGGAVYSTNVNLSLIGVTFDNNTGYSEGGAIYHNEGTLSINNSTFTNNLASRLDITGVSGGAIRVIGDSLTVTNSTFTNNTARSHSSARGGAVSHKGLNSTYNNNTFNNNSITSLIDQTTSGYYYTEGGAIFVNSGNFPSAKLTFTGNTLSNNSAQAQIRQDNTTGFIEISLRGGGLLLNSLSSSQTNLISENRVINNSTSLAINMNSTDSNPGSPINQGGGIAISSANGSGSNSFTANSFIGNSSSTSYISSQLDSTTQGGGLYYSAQNTIGTFTNNTFSQNSVDAGTVGVNRLEQGAALYVRGSSNFYYNTIYNNTAAGNGTNTSSTLHYGSNADSFLYGNIITNPSTDTGTHIASNGTLTLQGANNVISDSTVNLSNTFTNSTFAKDLTFEAVNHVGDGLLHYLIPRDAKLVDKGGSHDNTTTTMVTEYLTDQNGAVTLMAPDLRDIGAIESINTLPAVTIDSAVQQPDHRTYHFTASATDPDGIDANLTYAWDFDGDGLFDDASTLNAQYTFPSGGNKTVRLKVTDENGGETIVDRSFTVPSNPTTPVLTVADINEGANASLNISFTDADAMENHTVDIDWGDASTNTTGNITSGDDFTHTYAQDGTYTITVTITDNLGFTSSNTVSITVSNVAPTSADKILIVNEDTVLTFATSDFAFNDVAADSLQSVKITALPADGTLKLNTVNVSKDQVLTTADLANLTYTPAIDNNTNTSFKFTVSDGTDSSTEHTISITVNPVVDLTDDLAFTSNKNTVKVITFADLLGNDNFEGTGATITAITQPAQGATVLDAVKKTITLTPANDQIGAYDFTYTANTSVGTAETANVRVTFINNNPTAVNDTNSVNEPVDGAAVTAITGNLINNDTDPDLNDTLTIFHVDRGAVGTNTVFVGFYGTLTISSNGDYSYVVDDTKTANIQADVTERFTYQIQDEEGATSNTATLIITIKAQNDTPTLTAAEITIKEHETIVLNTSHFTGLGDVDSTDAQVTLNVTATNGFFTLDGTTAVTSFTLAQLKTLNQVKFVHDGSETAPSFTVTVEDQDGASVGPITGTVNFTKVNDRPVIDTAPTASTTELVLTGSLTGIAVTDPDGPNPFSYLALSNVTPTVTTSSGLVLNNVKVSLTTAGVYTLTGDNFDALGTTDTATITFDIQVSDGLISSSPATATITMTGANSAPVITVNNGILFNIATSENSNDVIASIAEIEVAAGTTPGALETAAGNLGLEVPLTEGSILTFNPKLKTGDDFTFDYKYNAEDNPFDSFFITINGQIMLTTGVFTQQSFTHTATTDGPVNISIISTNGGDDVVLSTGQVSNVKINGLAVPASAATSIGVASSATNDQVTVPEADDTIPASGALDVTDIDYADVVTFAVDSVLASGNTGAFTVNNDTDLLSIMSLNTGLASGVTNGQLNWNFSPSGGEFDYLTAGESLVLTYTVSATDSATPTNAKATHQITVTVLGTNDEPRINNAVNRVSNLTETDVTLTTTGSFDVRDEDINEEILISVQGLTLTGNQGTYTTDDAILRSLISFDGSAIAKGATQGTSNWTFSASSSLFDYLPDGDTLRLTYTIAVTGTSPFVAGGELTTATETIIITITGTNDAAVITASNQSIAETDEPVVLTGQVTSVDPDGPNSSFVAQTSSGTYGDFILASDGSYTYTAKSAYNELNEGDTLTDSFTVVTTDGPSQTITLTITGSNDIAEFSGDLAGEVIEDTDFNTLTATGQAIVEDLDLNQALFETNVTPAPGTLGSLTTSDNGRWSYTLDNNLVNALQTGETLTETFTIRSVDGTETNLTITVIGQNEFNLPAEVSVFNSNVNTINTEFSAQPALTQLEAFLDVSLLNFLSESTSLNFNNALSDDMLQSLRQVLNLNSDTDQEVAANAEGTEYTEDFYEQSSLSPEELQFIESLLEEVKNFEQETKEDEEISFDLPSFNFIEEISSEIIISNEVAAVSMDELDDRKSLDETLNGQFSIFA